MTIRDHPAPAAVRTIGVLLLLAALGSGVTSPADAAAASPPSLAIGVVSFYSSRPLNNAGGMTPEQFAAEDLSAMLGAVSKGRFVVISRDRVRQAENALRWRGGDALNFTRLGELAQRLHADGLVSGSITHYALNQEGWGAGAKRRYNGSATTVVQVFETTSHRMTWETSVSGHGRGASISSAGQDVLHNTVMRAVSSLATTLARLHQH